MPMMIDLREIRTEEVRGKEERRIIKAAKEESKGSNQYTSTPQVTRTIMTQQRTSILSGCRRGNGKYNSS